MGDHHPQSADAHDETEKADHRFVCINCLFNAILNLPAVVMRCEFVVVWARVSAFDVL